MCVCVCVCVCVYRKEKEDVFVCSSLSRVWIFCHPMDSGPPGSSVHGISQARILEWVVISFSRGFSLPRDRTCLFCVSSTGRQIFFTIFFNQIFFFTPLPLHHLGSSRGYWRVLKAKVAQSCLILCDSVDCFPPKYRMCVCAKWLRSCLTLCPPAPGSMELLGHEYWSGWPFPASLVAQRVKNPPAMQETWVQSLGQEDPWRRAWQLTPVFLHGESHGQRILVGYSPWGHKESETTEQLTLSF